MLMEKNGPLSTSGLYCTNWALKELHRCLKTHQDFPQNSFFSFCLWLLLVWGLKMNPNYLPLHYLILFLCYPVPLQKSPPLLFWLRRGRCPHDYYFMRIQPMEGELGLPESPAWSMLRLSQGTPQQLHTDEETESHSSLRKFAQGHRGH